MIIQECEGVYFLVAMDPFRIENETLKRKYKPLGGQRKELANFRKLIIKSHSYNYDGIRTTVGQTIPHISFLSQNLKLVGTLESMSSNYPLTLGLSTTIDPCLSWYMLTKSLSKECRLWCCCMIRHFHNERLHIFHVPF